VAFFASFLTFAHRLLAAFTIAALPAAEYALLDATKGRPSESFSRRQSKRKFNATTPDGIE
jgi:hypothetical protein